MNASPAPHWWLNAFVQTLKGLECDNSYRPRSLKVEDSKGPLWRFPERKPSLACEQDLPVVDTCNR